MLDDCSILHRHRVVVKITRALEKQADAFLWQSSCSIAMPLEELRGAAEQHPAEGIHRSRDGIGLQFQGAYNLCSGLWVSNGIQHFAIYLVDEPIPADRLHVIDNITWQRTQELF